MTISDHWRREMRITRPLLFCMLSFALLACRSSHPYQPPLSPAIFTPDGSAIVFSVAGGANCFLYQADIATGAVRRVTRASSGCESDPAFSPDGRQLAFMRASRSGEHAALVIGKPDGTDTRIIVPNTDDNLTPTFVPHSKQVLFLRSGAFEHYSPVVGSRRHKFDVFSVDAETGKVNPVTEKQFYEINNISVSDDGKELLLSVSTYREGEHFLVMPVVKSPSAPKSLRPSVPNGPPGGPIDYGAVWLPDGKGFLFYAATEPPGGGNFDYNLYRFTIASETTEKLTQFSGMLDGFNVSADGKKAVILRQGVYSILDLSTKQLTPVKLQQSF
jgi:Tol biopolymer transport system component